MYIVHFDGQVHSSLPHFRSRETKQPIMDTNGDAHSDSVASSAAAGDVDATLKSLLDVLTEDRFDPVLDWIVGWMNTECVKDVRKLAPVTYAIFERAKDDAARSDLYARLCRKMMEQISPNVHDNGIENAGGKPIAGGQLFRKYLLNRCQEDFERGWVAKEATAAAAATKASEDQVAKAAAGQNKGEEQVLYSEEYYAAQKAKRQGLGLIKFIGELFKLQMLTERIMHECVKKLLQNVEHPDEEEISSLCTLMTTVGQALDTQKARAHMDVYFSRMKELSRRLDVNSGMRSMLQDVIELRERKWIHKNATAAPDTMTAIHEQAFNRQLRMSRGDSRRGGERGDHAQVGPDGWAVAGGAAFRPSPKAGDLSKFGKIDKSAPMTFGPSSVFQKGDKSKSRESIVRQGSTNMFSMLSGNPEMAAEVAGESSRPPSRKSVPDGVAPQRRKLQLLPRSVPLENKSESTPAASTVGSEDEADEEPSGTLSMSEADAKARIEEDLKEFFSIRDLQEAEVYFTKLPSEHRHLLVDKLVTKAVESKQEDAQLVADLFERVISRNLCSPASFEEGFTPIAEIIDDIAIDAPKAMDLFVIMIKGSHLHLDEARRTRLASKSMENDKLIQALVADLSRAVKPERASITSASSSLPASQKGGNKLAFRPGSLDMFSMPSAGLDITVKGRSGNPNHPPSRTAPAPHLARSRTPAQFSTRDLQQAQAGVADVVSQHTARPIPTPVDSPQSAPRRRISWEAASECIERSASLFSGLHDVTTALAVFRDLPPSYHGRLVDRLVSAAMGSDTDLMGAQVPAYFFHCAAGRQLCSATAFKEGISMATSALEDIAADVPDALERYAVLVKAMGLHEDLGWRSRMLEKAGSHGAELAAWFSPV